MNTGIMKKVADMATMVLLCVFGLLFSVSMIAIGVAALSTPSFIMAIAGLILAGNGVVVLNLSLNLLLDF